MEKTMKRNLVATAVAFGFILMAMAGMWALLALPVTPHSMLLWTIGVVYIVAASVTAVSVLDDYGCGVFRSSQTGWRINAACIAGGAVLMAVVMMSSSPMLNAGAYAGRIEAEDGTEADLPSVEGADYIALMDTESAGMLGDRKIGSLADVVSQYEVAQEYTQISYQGRPVKVAPLEYAGFFKWKSNKGEGVPGYIIVDPVKMDAEYVQTPEAMKFVPSAFFGQDALRTIRREHPSMLLDNLHFEIDEEGHPYYVASEMQATAGLFGAKKVVGVVILDACSGKVERYGADEVPEWVDVAQSGDYICSAYNGYAQLQGGFLNSLIGQKGCMKATESREDRSSDFGYIAKGDDIWVYTGVTSVKSDASNVGFLIANERTGQVRLIRMAGADESSAMAAAEGEVQEKGYIASFPSLVLVDGEPTYVMVLKDDAGLVKMYACVNAEQYNLVAVDPSQAGCISRYAGIIGGEAPSDEAHEDEQAEEAADGGDAGQEARELTDSRDIMIAHLRDVVIDGNTYVYVEDAQGNVYRARFVDVVRIMDCAEGDEISIRTDGESFVLD